jgi:hypothetical protein
MSYFAKKEYVGRYPILQKKTNVALFYTIWNVCPIFCVLETKNKCPKLLLHFYIVVDALRDEHI